MKINLGNIQKKVGAAIQSSAVQKRAKAYVDDCVKRGQTTTNSGAAIVTPETVRAAAQEMIQMLQTAARRYHLPESVRRHFDSLTCGEPYPVGDGKYQIDISFQDDLTRMSLQPANYNDIQNIVALFNNGYPEDDWANRLFDMRHVSDIEKVWGVWHGQRIHALGSRPGLGFMEEAVGEFNAVHGGKYNATAYTGEDYETAR